MGNTIILDSLEYKQGDPVELRDLVASQRLNVEKGSRQSPTHNG